MQELKMGTIVKEKFTGIEYVIIGKITWMFGCDQYICKPNTDDFHERKSILGVFEEVEKLSDKQLIYIKDSEYASSFVEGKQKELFGKEVRDKVTNYTGICIGRYQKMGVADMYAVQAPIRKKRKVPKGELFDEGRLEIIGNGIAPEEILENQPKPGGSGDELVHDAKNYFKKMKKLNAWEN